MDQKYKSNTDSYIYGVVLANLILTASIYFESGYSTNNAAKIAAIVAFCPVAFDIIKGILYLIYNRRK